MIGFLEETKGVRSMTRLTIGWLMVLASAVVATACRYVWLSKTPSAEVIAALCALLTPIVVKGAIAVINRNPAEPEKP